MSSKKENKKPIKKLEKKQYVLIRDYGDRKKGQKISLTIEGYRYLKSIHKI